MKGDERLPKIDIFLQTGARDYIHSLRGFQYKRSFEFSAPKGAVAPGARLDVLTPRGVAVKIRRVLRPRFGLFVGLRRPCKGGQACLGDILI